MPHRHPTARPSGVDMHLPPCLQDTHIYISILSFVKSVKNFIADVKLLISCSHITQTVTLGLFSKGIPLSDTALLITPLYLYNSVSRILAANASIRSSIPGSCIAAPALFAVSIIANCPGR